MRIVQLITDNRQTFREYEKAEPQFHPATEALLRGFAEMPEIEVHVLSCIQKPVRAPEKLAENIWFHSLHVPQIGWLRTAYQGCIRAVRKKVRQIEPDIVHAQGTERECGICGIFSKRPNLLTVHGNIRTIAVVNRARPFSFLWLSAHVESFVLPRTDGVICITDYTQRLVRGKAKRTWIVPNAVDAEFFGVKPHPDAQPVILCVGVICLRKNQTEFIRSLDPLAAKHKFIVRFLGMLDRSDPAAAEFLKLVEQRPWCRYDGSASRSELRAALSSATMLVLPSLEDNCPMVVLEAMAAGVPVVAAKVGGVPDLIEDGITGLFCDPNSAISMREGVEMLLENPDRAKTLAGSAKERARLRFHPRVIAQQHVEIYRERLVQAGANTMT